MAETLEIVACLAGICSCGKIITNYSFRTLLDIRDTETSIANLTLELKSLQSSLSSLIESLENADAPSLQYQSLETFAEFTTQLQKTRIQYQLDKTTQSIFQTFPSRCLPSLSDPPPTIFILACIIYTFLFTRLRETQKDDPHRDKFILGGVGFGVAMGIYTREWENIKAYVAWFALAGLLLGACLHWAMPSSSDTKKTSRIALESREKAGDI